MKYEVTLSRFGGDNVTSFFVSSKTRYNKNNNHLLLTTTGICVIINITHK